MVEALAHRIGPALFDAGDFLVLHHLELAVRQGRLAEDLAKDLEDGGEVGALGLDRERDAAQPLAAASADHPHAHAGAQPGEVLVEHVLDLLAGQVLGASDHQLGQESAGLAQALEVLGVAVMEGQPQLDRLAPRLLGEEGELDARDRLGPLQPGLDGQRRRRRTPRSTRP